MSGNVQSEYRRKPVLEPSEVFVDHYSPQRVRLVPAGEGLDYEVKHIFESGVSQPDGDE